MSAWPRFLPLLVPLVLAGPGTGSAEANDRRSGFDFMGPQTQAMQSDDTSNPGMLAVLEGEELWNRKAGAADKSCADCHGDATRSMRGVAAHYPAFDTGTGGPINLDQRINLCREKNQEAEPFPWESEEILALSAFVGHQSRGMPVRVGDDSRLAGFLKAGEDAFHQKQGQLNFSCADCHDANWGKHLGGSVIPQGHATGYPIYRLEWQSMGSLQRRLRNCMAGVRAEPYSYGSPEFVELELYLMSRSRGMAVETPAVRP
jgi:L-cysteine S-thiosulfotransferase